MPRVYADEPTSAGQRSPSGMNRAMPEDISIAGAMAWRSLGTGMQMNESGQRSVLIVEDDEDLRSALEMLLDDDGFEVASAEHGAIALRLLESIEPDVILLDLNMPVMDGETFARRYRSQYGQEVPIVICTTSPPPSITERIGNASLLRKPIELDNLLETVHHLSQASEQ